MKFTGMTWQEDGVSESSRGENERPTDDVAGLCDVAGLGVVGSSRGEQEKTDR